MTAPDAPPSAVVKNLISRVGISAGMIRDEAAAFDRWTREAATIVADIAATEELLGEAIAVLRILMGPDSLWNEDHKDVLRARALLARIDGKADGNG